MLSLYSIKAGSYNIGMKSLWGSLGLGKSSGTVLGGLPRSGAGIIPYPEEERLTHLWIDITRSEEGCRNLNLNVQTYKESIKNVQESDVALVKGLSDSGALTLSPILRDAADEYLSVGMELKEKSNETCTNLQKVTGNSVTQYHGMYEHLEVLRKKRDAQLAEVQRLQDKLDRLKLKCKRTTDVIVEKDRALRILKELHILLVREAEKFHELRIPFFMNCLQAQVQLQVDYYGTAASEYNQHIKVSRAYNTVKDSEYFAELDHNLSSIKALKIVSS